MLLCHAWQDTISECSVTSCPVDQVPAFEVRLLGPVQAVRAGKQLALGGPMQRAILAMLLVEVGRVVPAGKMIEQLWRGRPPGGASITLRA
jgi:DNA-binding SARP family transcriptional activator